MNFRYSFLLLCAAVASVLSTNAQQNAPFMCSTHGLEHLAPLHQNDPHRLADIVQYEADLEAFTQQLSLIHISEPTRPY